MHSTDEITAHFGGLTIGTTDCVPFRPANSTRWQHLQLSPLPRFLFRVSTPKSDGSTDESWAKSRDAVNGLPCAAEDIFQSDDPSTVYKLTAHLWNYPNSRHDNMVSWTSSLLFAIQYIFYRHRKPEDSSTLDEIRLYVVDTAKFEKATFVRDMDLIRAFQLATCIWRDSNACGLMVRTITANTFLKVHSRSRVNVRASVHRLCWTVALLRCGRNLALGTRARMSGQKQSLGSASKCPTRSSSS